MATIPAKALKRIQDGVRKYKPVIAKAQSMDSNESDTVTIITDMLSDIFGYKKLSEITSEYAIKKTFCDIAIKIEDDVKLLIEVKAANINLKDNHLRQATDYGANSGIEWVVLTNGSTWKVYRILFTQPIEHELVYEFNFKDIKPSNKDDMNMLYMISKESIGRVRSTPLSIYRDQKKLLNGSFIAQVLLSDDTLTSIRRVLRKVSSDAKVTKEEIAEILVDSVIKEEALEDVNAKDYKKKIAKALK